ncbi:zinc knuckle CX2CX4HX4C containing protein [Tanacetum coccineum]
MQPYRNVNVVKSPMVVETLDATRADDGGVVIDVAAGNTNGPNVAEPAFSMGKNGHGVTSLNKEDEGTVKAVTSGTLNTSLMEGTMRDTNSPVNKLEEQKIVVKVATLTNKEKVLRAHVSIPLATVEEISAKFDNTMYGYFIGFWLAFPIVKNYVHNAWAKYGFESVIVRDGLFMFKFPSHEGMTKVLDGGPWFIRSRPLMLNIWCANTKIKKVDCTRIPVWIKIHNVPVVAFSEVGLSLITTQLGRPLMLDTCTSDMCLNPWGPKTYARVLIELSADKAIMDSITVVIPFPNGTGHSLENLDVAYEWRPLRCSNCKIFNHDDDCCPSRDTKVAPSSTLGNSGVPNVGSKGGKQPAKPKPKCVYRPVSKATQVDGKITSSVNQAGTNEAGNKPSGVPKDSSDTPLRDNENTKSVYAKVEGQVKGSDKGSILEQFRKSREDSSSKSISDSDDSEVEEVCMPYGISGGGLLDVLEDDLDCFDLTEQEQAFCDRYDICLNSRCRK